MSKFKSSDRIRRAKHEKNYTVILNATIQDSRLSWKARGLHHYILSLPDDWDICIAHLSEQSINDGMAIVKSALKELETFGYLSKVRLKDERGRFLKCVWNIYETPQVDFQLMDETDMDKPSQESPQVDFPQVDKPQVDKPQVENQPLLSNDLPSTNLPSNKEENTREEGIYAPIVKPEILVEPAQQVLIDVLVEEEKETTPPTPSPLSTENVGLVIADPTTKVRRTVQQEDQELFMPFLEIWNRSAPRHWDRYESLNVSMIDDLKKFVKAHKKESLQIFEEGLLELSADSFIGSTKCDKWRFSSYFTKGKPKKYSGYYRDKQQARSQQLQNNTDRPMTQSDIKNAETFVRLKERLNKELLTA